MLRWFTVGLIALSGAALAQDIDLAKEPVRVAPGKTKQLEFGTVPQRDTTVLLTIRSRMDSPGLGGSMYFLGLKLNGQTVMASKTRMVCRLMNRPLVSPIAPGLPYAWYGGGAWRALYAPDFEAALKQTYYTGNPYELVLDVTDLTNPAAENRLEISNTATADLAARLKSSLDLVIGKLTVTTHPGASPTMAQAGGAEQVINRGEPGAGPAEYKGELLPGGGFAVTVGGKRLAFESAFSYPKAGLNLLAAGTQEAAKGQAGWSVTVAAGNGGEVTARGPDYRVRRTVRFTPRKVEVADEITNAHADAPLGMLVQHSVGLKDWPDVAVRLAGNADVSVNNYFAPANPSVYMASGDLGVGMICEDDVFRSQARLFYDTETTSAGLRTEMLCLQPGETYTLRWSVYPVASRDYYDFINLVRQDWGANYTVEGGWCFFGPDQILDMPAEQLRERLNRLGVNYACSWGGWVDGKHDAKRIGFGTGVLEDYWADYRARLKRATTKLHEARPGIKVILYYDSQRDTHAKAGELYPDSKLTDAQGNHESTNWSGEYSLTWSMVATLANSFGKGMLGVVDAYMNEIGADGLYWDEMENVAFGYPLLTYSIPDGHTCLLDPKAYTIQRQVGNTTLLGEGHRLAVIDRVRAKGGTLMGNGPTTTRALLEKRVQRMVEIQHNDAWCYEGNLESPLGYASGEKEFSNVTRALGMATLLVGTRLDYDYEITPYLFPFTPIELHRGYLLGKERIITMYSGKYGWPGETARCKVRTFDKDGKMRKVEEATAGAGEERVKVELGEGEVTVIERVNSG